MQFEGGYRYPSREICTVLTVSAVIVVVTVSWVKSFCFARACILFFSLEGPVLLGSAFTPTGQVPPPRGIISQVRWFFREQSGVPLKFNQPLFYGGLLLSLAAIVMAALE